ncbi:MAG: helix-turn-helix domain-containing protein [Bryobacterales bacterium]|nr:helix-turn-helix domain-containing protein [Bryobacterales bacterium]
MADTRTELPRIRQRRGMSAAQIAALAGVSRQTIYAIEAGDYVPNTTLALQLARILEVRVEELFHLENDIAPLPKPVTVELLGDARQGQPVQLCPVGKRLIGVAAVPQPVLPLADGVVVGGTGRGPAHRADVRVFPSGEQNGKRILVAGCDPGISLLAQHLAKAEGIEMILAPGSSQRALEWLKDGAVHIAGTHLRDASTGDYNLAAIRRLFPKGGVKVVTFAIWEQGLVFAAGNPKGIHGVGDLGRPGIRLINREKGAGSRELLDRELQRAGVAAESVKGYERIAQGHLPAALAVSLGEADCCIATRSAAQAFGLGFVPLATERYDLVIRRAFVKLPAVEALLDGLNRSAIRRRLELLAGYDTSHTGEVRVT